MAAAAFVVALLGAESTGKTTLAHALAEAMRRPGRRVAVVDEYLREFCARRGRTPARGEQAAIADEQTRRIQAAAADHDLVFADTTALMTAVYSDWVFGDASLYPTAEKAHLACDLTLLMALDIAWQEDGLQRDSAQVREPVDQLIRAALTAAGTGFAVIAGTGAARLAAAVAGVELAIARATAPATSLSRPNDNVSPRWHWHCERCGDPDCERKGLLS